MATNKSNQYHKTMEALTSKTLSFDSSDYIRKGWDIFQSKMGLFILFGLVYMGILSLLPEALLIINAPLVAGLFIVARKIRNEEEVEFNDFFKGFEHFGPLFIASVISGLLIFVGTMFFIIPGIYLAIVWSFSVPFILFLGMDAWPSLQASMKFSNKNFVGVAILFLVLTVINLIGLLFCGVGLIITIPLTYTVLYAAFEDMVEQTDAETIAIEAAEEEEDEPVKIEAPKKKKSSSSKKKSTKKSTSGSSKKKTSTTKTKKSTSSKKKTTKKDDDENSEG